MLNETITAKSAASLAGSSGFHRWAGGVGIVAMLANEFFWRDLFLPHRPSMTQIWIALGGEWLALLLLLALWLPRVERRGLASIGVTRFRWSYVWMGAGAYIATFAAVAGVQLLQQAIGQETIRALQPTLATYPWPVLIALFVTGTVLEELLYRGYLIERLILLTGSRWLAGLVSWAAFTLVHLRFFGAGATVDVAVLSAVLVLLYMRTRSLWPAMIFHGINDAFGFLLAPLLPPSAR
jgi:membrane protease YdiL (CAAX protease family)